jgi:Skp family chaperone for outer membrane proteins
MNHALVGVVFLQKCFFENIISNNNFNKTKMKKLLSLIIVPAVLFTVEKAHAQQVKIGVFDVDLMVRAMPGYTTVDSLLQIYDRDSIGPQYDNYMSQYKTLDSTYKADSLDAATGKKSKALWDSTAKQRQQVLIYLINWQQIVQYNEEQKRGQLAQPLYEQVANAYKKILDSKKYSLILKPGAFEQGTTVVDNLFITVAKELKLQSLPRELLMLGPDPDAPKTGTTTPQKTNPAPNKKP